MESLAVEAVLQLMVQLTGVAIQSAAVVAAKFVEQLAVVAVRLAVVTAVQLVEQLAGV